MAHKKSCCDALVPASTYREMGPCQKRHGLRRCGRLLLCPHHARMSYEREKIKEFGHGEKETDGVSTRHKRL